jgi:hypothetical protein
MPEHINYSYSEEGSFAPGPHLPFDQYKAALKRMVKYCHDVIFVNSKGQFLLAKRRADKDAAGEWCIGGQVAAFTHLHESLEKTITRETGLTIPRTRFHYIGQDRMWFNGSEEHGVMHDVVSEFFIVKLTDEEIKAVKLDPTEYQENSLQVYDLKDLEALEKPLKRAVFTDLWKRFHDK